MHLLEVSGCATYHFPPSFPPQPSHPSFPAHHSLPPHHPPDLWSNACVRCPEALDKLNALAGSLKEEVEEGLVFFASVNIDDKAKARGLVAER